MAKSDDNGVTGATKSSEPAGSSEAARTAKQDDALFDNMQQQLDEQSHTFGTKSHRQIPLDDLDQQLGTLTSASETKNLFEAEGAAAFNSKRQAAAADPIVQVTKRPTQESTTTVRPERNMATPKRKSMMRLWIVFISLIVIALLLWLFLAGKSDTGLKDSSSVNPASNTKPTDERAILAQRILDDARADRLRTQSAAPDISVSPGVSEKADISQTASQLQQAKQQLRLERERLQDAQLIDRRLQNIRSDARASERELTRRSTLRRTPEVIQPKPARTTSRPVSPRNPQNVMEFDVFSR